MRSSQGFKSSRSKMTSFCLLIMVSLSFLAGSTSGCLPQGEGQGSITSIADSCFIGCGGGGIHINIGRKGQLNSIDSMRLNRSIAASVPPALLSLLRRKGGSDYVEKTSRRGNNNSGTMDGHSFDSKETSGVGEFEESAGENNDYKDEESSTDWLIGKMFAIRKGSNHAKKISRTGSETTEGDSQFGDSDETSGAEEFQESGEINGYNGNVYSGAWENA